MLWLGVRKLARFQVTGGSADSDLLVTGPALAPEALADLLRCRPSGAFLNLIRKELRLLRPLWLISFFTVIYVALLALLRILPAPPVSEPRYVLEWVLLGPLVSICVAMAGLGGILSLGEERTSGTQAWHMTLPISARRQWLVKLVVGMVAGLCCSLVFPVLAMIAGGAVYGSPLMFVNIGTLPDLFIIFAILTFSCFWCACAGYGTVSAAVWAVPVTAIIALTCSGGLWLGDELAQAKGTLRDFLVSALHLSPFTFATFIDFARQRVLWLFMPTLLFALLQSYQLFREQSRGSVAWTLRCLLPLVAVTVSWSFASAAAFGYSRWEPFLETRKALDRIRPTTAPIELSGDELVKTNALSLPTRRWLTGSHILAVPDSSLPRVYYATIRLASGTECKLTVVQYAGIAASCGRRSP